MWGLYKTQPSFVLGFHGCDEQVGLAAIAGTASLTPSTNDYDWLGDGIYFWEGSPDRAIDWAMEQSTRPGSKVKTPYVVGAIIELGHCCNLSDLDTLKELRRAYDFMEATGEQIPENRGRDDDKLRRFRDRAVIQMMHRLRDERNLARYTSVRSSFHEGEPLYPGAGITARSHVQIAVRDARCIKGYFKPIKI